MLIYGLMNCDTCRKARKALPDARFVDLRAEGLPDGLLERGLEAFGEKMLNKRSTTWRGLNDAERERAPLVLLEAHPSLMKRPLIEAGGKLYLGWDPEVQAALGG